MMKASFEVSRIYSRRNLYMRLALNKFSMIYIFLNYCTYVLLCYLSNMKPPVILLGFFLFILLSIHEKRLHSILLFIFPKEKRGLAADPATIICLKNIYLCMRFSFPVYISSYTRRLQSNMKSCTELYRI